MGREVFQSNKIILFLVIAVVYGVVTYGYLASTFPLFVLPIVFVIGLFIIYSSIKTKLVIENGMLRYEKFIGREEVELRQVSQIVIRHVDTRLNNSPNQTVFHDQENPPPREGSITIGRVKFSGASNTNSDGKIEKIMYIQDEAGRTYFSVPANVVRYTHRQRFKAAIHRENSNIDID